MGAIESLLKADLKVVVKTGDVKGAGTDSNVYCCLIDDKGFKSRNILLDVKWRNDFEKGNLDEFDIRNVSNLSNVVSIELWRDQKGVNDSWFVEYIIVKHSNYTSPFPCNRWIEANKKYVFYIFNSSLPQYDPCLSQRKQELEANKVKYIFTNNSEVPKQVANLPIEENFSFSYKWDVVSRKIKLITQAKLTGLLTSEKWTTIGDYLKLYKGIFPVPYGFNNWQSDEKFGEQRLRGCNPVLIQLCKKVPDNFPVTNEMVSQFLDGFTLEETIEKKQLFIVNLAILENLILENGRTVCAPMALFYANKNGTLLPVAIQLFQKPSEENPIFLPSDPQYTWLLAKMYFNNADCSLHQSCTHLGLTHLLCESICVAAHQNLSLNHPVFQLLAPHFLYIMAINSLALKNLVSPGGWIDKTMTIGVSGLMEILKRSWQTFKFDRDCWLPNDISARGVGDTEILKNYFYRDDALLIHEAIVNYVTEILSRVYDTPDKLKTDYEVQNWAICLSDETNGAGIKGVFGNGNFDDLNDLIKFVASVIFICSVGHAAANFCQYDEYAFPPSYPAMLTGKIPSSKAPLTMQDIINQLPNKETTLDTMAVTKMLSERGTNELGTFEIQYLFRPEDVAAVERFKSALAEISNKIKKRNEELSTPYPYLDPKEVPNAISI
uniref:Arachidonate 5-lipoxygenase n=1 Tax=Hydra vulgaris TaxID=6087 RepID=T2MH56_HYDVU